jgi:ferritin-like metal-binding protein YciE
MSVGRTKNVAAEGLIDDGQQLADEIEDDEILDAALIRAIQKIQHYCLASWGTTAASARATGQDSLLWPCSGRSRTVVGSMRN